VNEHGCPQSLHPKCLPESGAGAGIPAIPTASPAGTPGRKASISLPSSASGAKVPSQQLQGRLRLFADGDRAAARGCVLLTQQAFSSVACTSKQRSHAPWLEGRCLENHPTLRV